MLHPASRTRRRRRAAPPGLLRLWARSARRRPGRAAVVVAGQLAMAVAVSAALLGSAALERFVVDDALARWGRTDVLVTAGGGALLEEPLARSLGGDVTAAAHGWAPRLELPAVASGPDGTAEPHAVAIGVAPEEAQLEPLPPAAGSPDLAALGPGQVLLNRRLATRLDLAAGDRIDLVLAAPRTEDTTADGRVLRVREAEAVPWRPEVAGIVPDRAVAAAGGAPAVLLPLSDLQRVTDLRGWVSGLHVAAAPVGQQPGAGAVAAVEAAAEVTARRTGSVVTPVKDRALRIAEDEAGLFGGILLALALLVILASVAVTANLVVLLGRERAAEVAVLRASGAGRRTVRVLLTAEAGAYAVLAAALGALAAAPVGGVLADRLAGHLAALELGRGREAVAPQVAVDPALLLLAGVVVVAAALVAGWLGARQVADLDVEQVLRGHLPDRDPAPPTGQRRPAAAAAAGLLVLRMGLSAPAGAGVLRFAGLGLLGTAWWLHRRREAGDLAAADRRAAACGLLWCATAPAVLVDPAGGLEGAVGLLVVAGAGAVGCAAALLAGRMRAVGRVVRSYLPLGRSQSALQVAVGWAERDRWRSATVIGVVGVVVLMVAALAVLGGAAAIDVDRQGGGIDVVGTAVAGVDPAALQAADGIGGLAALQQVVLPEDAFRTEDAAGRRRDVPHPVRIIRADPALADLQSFGVAAALPSTPTADDALGALLRGSGGAVLDRTSRPDGTRPGDTVVLDVGRGQEELPVLAVLDTSLLGGVVLAPEVFDDLFADHGPTLLLAAAATTPDAAADALEAAGRPWGVTADTAAEVAADVVAANRAFTDVFALLLQVGLAVAAVAVAAMVGRALRERRADLAVLRAAGWRRRDVVLAATAEPVLLVLLGALAGGGGGLGILWLLLTARFGDLPIDVAWRQVAATAGTALAVVAAGSLLAAAAAARRDPAADLRDLG